MKIIFCHLSDIHFTEDEKANSIISKQKKIVDAVISVADREAYLFIIVSGDISQSGAKEEYNIALDFFINLNHDISQHLDNPCEFIFVPGNHDCDFSDNELNKVIEDTIAKIDEEPSDSQITSICKKQCNYYDFFVTICNKYCEPSILIKQKDCTIEEKRILINMINTAWISEREEKPGKLFIPENQLVNIDSIEYDLVVSTFHHPVSWLSPNKTSNLKKFIHSTSDMIFVGHEHTGEEETVESREYSYKYYYGEVLQDPNNKDNSGFTTTTIDLNNKGVHFCLFRWNAKNSLYEQISTKNYSFTRNKTVNKRQLKINDNFRNYLSEPSMDIQHKYKDPIKLEDIYIYPDLNMYSKTTVKDNELFVKVRSANIYQQVIATKKMIITGDLNSGKTSFAKTIFSELQKNNIYCLFLEGEVITSVNETLLQNTLNKAIIQQYCKEEVDIYNQLYCNQKAIIIDNFDNSILNNEAKKELLNKLSGKFDYIIAFSSITYEIDVLIDNLNNGITEFARCSICEMGHALRHKLIKKWYMLGREQIITDQELDRLERYAEQTINTLMGDGYMPTIPAHILIVLQQLDLSRKTSDLSSHGYLYEFLISRSILMMGNGQSSSDVTTGYLTQIAYYMFKNKQKSIDNREAQMIAKNYNDEYDQEVNADDYIHALTKVNLMKKQGDDISFSYSYIYYYYVAKHLANNLDDTSVFETIDMMAKRLFNEDYGNIMIFLCHLTKNSRIVNCIINNAMTLFNGVQACNFTTQQNQIKQLESYVEEILDTQQIVYGDLEDRKIQYFEQQDRNEDVKIENPLKNYDDITEDPSINQMLQINNAFRTMEVMGQILRNYPGTIKGNLKAPLLSNTYQLGMRTLTVALDVVEQNIEPMIQLLAQELIKQSISLDNNKILHEARNRIAGLVYSISYGMLRKVAFCISHELLLTSLDKVDDQDISYKLVYQSVLLNNLGRMKSAQIVKLFDTLMNEKNKFSAVMLRKMVIDHFYLFGSSDHATRQKLCDKMDIKFEAAQMLPRSY